MDERAVLCTLAKRHVGDHDARGVLGRSACRKVIRYEGPPLDPAAVATLARDAVDRDLAQHVDDGEPFDPVAHAEAMAEAKEALRLPHEVAAEHNHEGFGESTFPLSCPLCVTLLASLTPPTSLGGLAGCDGHDHGSLTKCVPPCPAFDPTLSSGPSCARRGGIVTAWLGDAPPGWKPWMRPPCIACGAESGEECRKAAPPEPSTQDLIAAAVGAWGRRDGRRAAVQEARFALEKEGMFLDGEEHGLLLAQSALAKHVGHGKFVLVGGATFKARKPRGDGLWTLVPVEVAK